MENFKITNGTQSQPTTPLSKILSPSPMRKASCKVMSTNIARELFSTVTEEVVNEDPFNRGGSSSPSNFMKNKFFSLKGENESASTYYITLKPFY